jgi:hypothetical protein
MVGATVATWVKVKTKTGLTSRPISHKHEGGAGFEKGQVITQSEYDTIKANRSEKVSTIKEYAAIATTKDPSPFEDVTFGTKKTKKERDAIKRQEIDNYKLEKKKIRDHQRKLEKMSPEDRRAYTKRMADFNVPLTSLITGHPDGWKDVPNPFLN